MEKRWSLSVYRIRDAINGYRVQNMHDVVADPDNLLTFDLADDFNFDAQLFVAPSKKKRPPWTDFLEPGFGELTEVEDSVVNSAVLIVKVLCPETCFFALPFGFGRYLLKPNSVKWRYGLKVALNLLYPSGVEAGMPQRIRSVDIRTVAANTLHTRRQMDRRAVFEDFGVDVQRDFLKSVTGQPYASETWGNRLSGSGSLKLSTVLEFGGLGDLLVKIESRSRDTDYQDQFSWVDNVRIVTNSEIKTRVQTILLNRLENGPIEGLGLAPPELIDWDQLAEFRYSIDGKQSFVDVELEDYLSVIDAQELGGTLTIEQLTKRHRLEAFDDEGILRYRWYIYRCLTGEIAIDGKTYLINGGDLFEVSENYLQRLDDFIRTQLSPSDVVLPSTASTTTEGKYNEDAANSSDEFLLLDKKTVKLDHKTSPIEICDILTDRGQFVHVKRKLASSSLSHLFGQGYVSADLFHMSTEYRNVVKQKVQQAEIDRENENGGSFQGRFSNFNPDGITPSRYEIIYAIVANWKNRSFERALPFFSKVNLRRHVVDLRRMGYRVKYRMVQAD